MIKLQRKAAVFYKTKESIALGNDVNKLDSKLNFELQFQFDLVLMVLSRQLM
jgi:hypothetical protein